MTPLYSHMVETLAQRHVAALREVRRIRVYNKQPQAWCRETGGKWRIGYDWSRPYSHHFNGLVYQCVLGTGGSVAAALHAALRRVERLEAKFAASPAQDGAA
jgi:hypothetical protein